MFTIKNIYNMFLTRNQKSRTASEDSVLKKSETSKRGEQASLNRKWSGNPSR